jgi:SAM-dependent methyltransferase
MKLEKIIDLSEQEGSQQVVVPESDYKQYVGGHWDEVGEQQLEFLKNKGLQPYHSVLEVGCGSLRAGRLLIKYLDYDGYCGIDHNKSLIETGINKELDQLSREKRPVFIVSDNFDFSPINDRKFDFAIAKSVFTHLTKDKIKQCLINLKPLIKRDGEFYASIFNGKSDDNLEESHDNKKFKYTIDEIRELAEGWNVSSVGKPVGHRQEMLKFVPKGDNFRVSIVTAAYRVEYMDRVWQSIQTQTFKDWNWVIVNDGQPTIKDWYLNKELEGEFNGYNVTFIDLGISLGRFGLYARNIGTMAALSFNTNRITYHDDDNVWTEYHLESMVNLEKETGKIPYCWLHIKGKKEGSTFDRIKPTALARQSIDLGCILYRKNFFNKYGYFKDTHQVTFDFDFMKGIFDGEGVENFICTNKPSLIFWHKRY